MDEPSPIYACDTAAHAAAPHTLSGATRRAHVLLCGVSPHHKPALLWNLILQDVEAGAGVAVIDLTGDFADPLLDHIPAARAHQTYRFAPDDPGYAVGFNPFAGVPEPARARTAQEIMELFRAIWGLDYERTPLLLDILRATARALLDWPESTLLSMYQLLVREEFRARVVARCTDPITRSFWREFERWPAADRRDKPQSVLTRLRAFLSDAHLRNGLGQVRGALDIERAVREGQVLLADFSADRLGGETAMLFGSLLASRLRVALSIAPPTRPFYTYIPECQLLHPGLSARFFAGAPYPGGATLSVSDLGGEPPAVRGALLRAGTLLTFRLGPDDVRHVAARFSLAQAETTLLSLPPDRLASTLHPYELAAVTAYRPRRRQRDAIVRRSRAALAMPTAVIERKVRRFLEGGPSPKYVGWE